MQETTRSLLLATHNTAKIAELKRCIMDQNDTISIMTLSDLHIDTQSEETGATIDENAIEKAKHYAQQTGLAVLADDAGFEIAALNGEPGVLSNRWLGYRATDQELIDHTLERMKDVPDDQRHAALVVCLCYHNPETGTTKTARGETTGMITHQAHRDTPAGFPFRAVFEPDSHDQVAHRRNALETLLPEILKDLIQ